jgi:hypothetical protein
MLTYRHLRHATRWNRRFAFALAVLALLAVSWHSYRSWQRAQTPVLPAPITQVV